LQKCQEYLQITSTEEGKQMDGRAEQCENASFSIRVSLEFGSKVRLSREVQAVKAFAHTISREAGMQSDLSAEQSAKAADSIRVSLEFDSNVRVQREVQYSKQF
jgi:hypothetical protein